MFHPHGPTFWELAEQALSSTQRGYDLLAPKFDYTPFRTGDDVLAGVADYLRATAPFERVLDLCCGTGAGMEMLGSMVTGEVAGIDFSEKMLEIGQRNLADLECECCFNWILGDVMSMDFRNQYDLAVCFGALGHILRRDESEFVRRIARSLCPGGRFVFVTHEMPSTFSLLFWLATGFNASIWIRNLIKKPPFIMYYLTFLWPDVKSTLNRHGLRPRVYSPFTGKLRFLRLVDAVKEESTDGS